MQGISLLLRRGGVLFLDLIVLLIPLVGQVVASWMILREGRKLWGSAFWMLVVWILPYAGPGGYLLFGRRYGRRRSWLLLLIVLGLLLILSGVQALG